MIITRSGVDFANPMNRTDTIHGSGPVDDVLNAARDTMGRMDFGQFLRDMMPALRDVAVNGSRVGFQALADHVSGEDGEYAGDLGKIGTDFLEKGIEAGARAVKRGASKPKKKPKKDDRPQGVYNIKQSNRTRPLRERPAAERVRSTGQGHANKMQSFLSKQLKK